MKTRQKPRVSIELPEWAHKWWTQRSRYKVAYGGRGSAKSHSIARLLLMMAMQSKKRILCTREVQNSIKDSVHKLLKDLIFSMMLTGFTITDISIKHSNGSEFLFKGMHGESVESIKSMEGVDIVWIEEAQTISRRSLEILIPTIRKPGSEIWISFNPFKDDDPVYVDFVLTKRPNSIVDFVNWYDNPWFPDELIEEKDYLYANNPDRANHVWGGQTIKNTDQQVFKKWRVLPFEFDEKFGPAYQGLDFGFSQDPMAFTRMYVHEEEKRIYFRYAIAKVGILPSSMKSFLELVPDVKRVQTIADNARPELIKELKEQGFNIIPCTKYKGSVEDGVQWMQDYELIIHPDCLKADYANKDEKYTIDEEFSRYSFKVDKRTGLITTDLEDKNNHYTDASRYGLEKFITKKKGWAGLYG